MIGILSGIICALPFCYYFNANPIVLSGDQKETVEKFGFDAVIPLSIDFGIPLTHGLIIFIISLFIALYPTWHIYKMDAIKSMKR